MHVEADDLPVSLSTCPSTSSAAAEAVEGIPCPKWEQNGFRLPFCCLAHLLHSRGLGQLLWWERADVLPKPLCGCVQEGNRCVEGTQGTRHTGVGSNHVSHLVPPQKKKSVSVGKVQTSKELHCAYPPTQPRHTHPLLHAAIVMAGSWNGRGAHAPLKPIQPGQLPREVTFT